MLVRKNRAESYFPTALCESSMLRGVPYRGAQNVPCHIPSCPKALETCRGTPVFPHGVGKTVKAEGQEQEPETPGDTLPNPCCRCQASTVALVILGTRESRPKGLMIWCGALSVCGAHDLVWGQ